MVPRSPAIKDGTHADTKDNFVSEDSMSPTQQAPGQRVECEQMGGTKPDRQTYSLRGGHPLAGSPNISTKYDYHSPSTTSEDPQHQTALISDRPSSHSQTTASSAQSVGPVAYYNGQGWVIPYGYNGPFISLSAVPSNVAQSNSSGEVKSVPPEGPNYWTSPYQVREQDLSYSFLFMRCVAGNSILFLSIYTRSSRHCLEHSFG